MQMLLDIPDPEAEQLSGLAVQADRSLEAEVREAITRHILDRTGRAWIYGEGFGFWKDRDDIPDAVEYQRAMREDRDPI